MARRVGLAAVVLAAGFALAGCGLPFYVTLNPPGTPAFLASEGNLAFTILATTANNEAEFRGFELFYKFYASSGAVEQNLQNALPSDLTGTYGYRRVCDQLDTFSGTPAPTQNLHSTKPYPLIFVPPADRGTVFSVTITFPGFGLPIQSPVSVSYNGAPYYAPNDSTAPLSLRRNVGDTALGSSTSSECKYFIAALLSDPLTYQSTDYDMQSNGVYSAAIAAGGTAYLAMYVLSYGVQSDFTTETYSTPVYLGYVPVNINQ